MYKATRVFIAERQKFCHQQLDLVSVKSVGGGKASACSNNACDAAEAGDRVRSITGWLVHPYNPVTDSTDIIQHWWNMDRFGQHFDTSPNVDDKCEYVVDMDLVHYYHTHYDQVDNMVAISLSLRNGKFWGFDYDDSLMTIKILNLPSLATEVLYRQSSDCVPQSELSMKLLTPAPQPYVSLRH